MPYGGAIRMQILKCDSLGNTIWRKTYGTGQGYYRGYSIVQTSELGYAIGGYLFYIGQDYSGDPIVFKTDSLGNQLWLKNLGGQYKDHIAMLSLSNDGGIIVGTCYADSMINSDVAFS